MLNPEYSAAPEEETTQVIRAGELFKNIEKYVGQTFYIRGFLREAFSADTSRGGPTTIVAAKEKNHRYYWGSKYWILVDPIDADIMPIATRLKDEEWENLKGKQVSIKIKVQKFEGIAGALLSTVNSFKPKEKKVTSYPKILEIKEI